MVGGGSDVPVPGWGHLTGPLAIGPQAPVAATEAAERWMIAERVSRYGWSFDERRADLLGECFTEQGVWEGSIMGGEPLGPFEGRDTILEFMTGFWATQRDQRRHAIVNPVIEMRGEQGAVAHAYQVLMAARAGQVALETTGFYRFELERGNGIWRIARLYSGYDAPFEPGKLDHLG